MRKHIVLKESFVLAIVLSVLFCYARLPVLLGPVSAQQEYPPEIQEKFDRQISLDLRNMNVVDVYKFLAVKGDFNISISNTISGRVTLFLKQVSIKDALDIISIANNLAYRLIGDNIIHVMTARNIQRCLARSLMIRKK